MKRVMTLNRMWPLAVLLCTLVLAIPAYAHSDDAIESAIGAGLGGAIGAILGNELGGERAAALGGALGAATGVILATDGDEHYAHEWSDDDWLADDDREWEEDDD